MLNKRIIWSGLAAGVLCHILQGVAAYLVFDRFYLQNPDLIRDSSMLVGFFYLAINLIVGLVIALLAHYLKRVWTVSDWQIGLRAGLIVWAASSPVFILRRQILLNLSNWLLLEIPVDLAIYAVIGMVAGFLTGRGIIDTGKDKS